MDPIGFPMEPISNGFPMEPISKYAALKVERS
jgi:hypothetical protein